MYGYTDGTKLKPLVLESRIAVVVRGLPNGDPYEYINSCVITLKNSGVGTENLLQPKLFTDRRTRERNLLLTVKKGVTPEQVNIDALGIWANEMGNVETVQQYVRRNLL